MLVYAYFDASPNLPDQGQVIRLWHDSWRRFGWTPRLLHPRNAQRHRWWEKATSAQRCLIAPPLARWFALDAVERGSALLVDYDVINFGLTPRRVCGPMSLYGSGAVGSSRPGRRLYLRALMEDGGSLFPHTARRDDWAFPYLSPGWESSPLVRFTRHTFTGPKHRAILSCGRDFF